MQEWSAEQCAQCHQPLTDRVLVYKESKLHPECFK